MRRSHAGFQSAVPSCTAERRLGWPFSKGFGSKSRQVVSARARDDGRPSPRGVGAPLPPSGGGMVGLPWGPGARRLLVT